MNYYEVFYMKPNHFSTFIFGDEKPKVTELKETHARVRGLAADSLEDVFHSMQGEVWSPNGEAREQIESLGLGHTSMSVGDVVYWPSRNEYHVVARFGFEKLEQ